MSDESRPALTPEEWAQMVVRRTPTRARLSREPAYPVGDEVTVRVLSGPSICVHPDDLHALAALALHGQPFGFTREDVATLREAAREIQYEFGSSAGTHPQAERLEALAARIAALLPPEPTP